MRRFLSKAEPPFDRVLLIESGSRSLFEDILSGFYETHPDVRADLVTCYAGLPQHFRPESGAVYRVTEYRDSRSRRSLYAEMAATRYNVIAMICSGEPIMTKWKWMLAARLSGKVLILNENCDYFWFDRGHLSTIWHFTLVRAGLAGAGAVRTAARLVVFPFAIVYLILFAATVHLRRKLRTL